MFAVDQSGDDGEDAIVNPTTNTKNTSGAVAKKSSSSEGWLEVPYLVILRVAHVVVYHIQFLILS